MELNVNTLINFFKKFSTTQNDSEEIDEQADATQASAGSTGTATGTKSGKPVKKWETGLTRGHANQVGNTKWESGRKLGKTYMNDPKYVWKSDRNMGKTGGSDFA